MSSRRPVAVLGILSSAALFAVSLRAFAGASAPSSSTTRAIDDDELARLDPILNGCDWENDACFQDLLARSSKLLADHPEDLSLLLLVYGMTDTAALRTPELMVRFKARVHERHVASPEDLVYAYVDALMIDGSDGEAAFEALVRAHPDDGLARLGRARAISRRCPGEMDPTMREDVDAALASPDLARRIATMSPALESDAFWAVRAPILRAMLRQAHPLQLVRAAPSLWSLEFRTTPPRRYDEVRARIKEDLARIEAIPYEDLPGWWRTVARGYELAGDPAGQARAKQEMAARSPCAYDVVRTNVESLPTVSPDRMTTTEIEKVVQTLDGWLKDCPGNYDYEDFRFGAIKELRGLGNERVLAEIDHILSIWERTKFYVHGFPSPWATSAQLLLERGLRPDQALDLVRKEKAEVAKWRADLRKTLASYPPELQTQVRAANSETDLAVKALEIEALFAAHRDREANASVVQVADDVDAILALEKDESRRHDVESKLWLVRGIAAARADRNADALAFLLHSQRLSEDPAVTRRIERAWKAMGGSAETLSAITAAATPEGSTRWQTESKPMAPFELVDLDGKTWHSSDLVGKTVFLTVWATWCGPCREEIPHFVKAARALSDRPDVVTLTFNIDDNTGQIKPFAEKEGIEAPILLAFAYVRREWGFFAVPQTWIVDGDGIIRRKQMGFDPKGSDRWVEDAVSEVSAIAAK